MSGLAATIAATVTDIEAALRAVDGVRVFALGAPVQPPALNVGPPTLTWGAMGPEPTGAVFSVAVMAPATERASETLYGLVEPVAAVLDALADVVVISAEPGEWTTGTTTLPAYVFRIEVSI